MDTSERELQALPDLTLAGRYCLPEDGETGDSECHGGAMTEKSDHAQVGNSLSWCQKKAEGRGRDHLFSEQEKNQIR